MTKQEIKQQAKLTALNKIRKICHPDYKGLTSNYWDESNHAEQRSEKITDIIEGLEKELKDIEKKFKKDLVITK